MRVAVDLHIHSALSPCCENDMTPNNIVNMSVLKGIDIIAVTDHNSLENFYAISKCAQGSNIVVVPGMELETREEVHMICLLPNIEAALKMQTKIYSLLPDIKNREDIFGEQLIMDENDTVKRHYENMLVTAADISIDEACLLVRDLGGVVIPAHVDRSSYSVISNLGMIPQHLDFKYLEISKNCSLEKLLAEHPELNGYSFITSSDAHNLGDILERECFLELEQPGIEALIKTLRGI